MHAYQEDILAANTLLIGNREFAIGKLGDYKVTQGAIKSGTDFLSQVASSCTREYQE